VKSQPMPKAKTNGLNAPSALSVSPSPEPAETANLDKVRDILFGQQSRDLERRLDRSEERFRADLESAQRDSADRIQTLEDFVRQELQALKERLSAESEARLELAERTARQAEADRAESERARAAQSERFQQNLAELREAMLEQGKRHATELKALREASQQALEREVTTLTHNKVDRSTLARSLADLALQIGNDEDGA
jgi:hypothetical protein